MCARDLIRVESFSATNGVDSMAEAITDAKKRAASEQLEEVNTKCTGSILVNALWEDTRCSICLSNGRAIDICADGEGLKWHVVEHGARGQQYAHVAQTLWLDFATEEDPYAWDRYEALRKRMGRELKGV